MIDWVTVGLGWGVALLGGMGVALWGQRLRLCPLTECPALEAGQRLELTVSGRRYTTLLHQVEGKVLQIVPPLQRGAPVSFELGALANLQRTTPAGGFEASGELVGRSARAQPVLHARLASRWRHTQRRRYERILLPDEAQVALEVEGEQWIGWACDASEGGLRMVAPVPAPPNAQVRLELPPALAGAEAERLARVVACERAPTRHGYAFQLRLAFLDA
ncbi:MAG: PilZ domain-containing protein [Fimbriimonadales bacterium]